MSKATYSVAVIRKGREKDYFDFWTHDLKTNSSGEGLHPDLVGFNVAVEAKNKQEAASMVEKMYPGLSIDMEATVRHG